MAPPTGGPLRIAVQTRRRWWTRPLRHRKFHQCNRASGNSRSLWDLGRQGFAFGDDETGERPISHCAVVNAFVNFAAFDEECVPGFVVPCWLSISLDCNRPFLNIDIQRSGVRMTAFPPTWRHFDRCNTRSEAGYRQIVLNQHLAHSIRRRCTGGRPQSGRARRKNDCGSGKCIPDRHVLPGP